MDSLHTTESAYWKAEAERLAGDNARLQAENAELRARVSELEGQIGALTERVTTLAKLVFGTSSEKSKSVEMYTPFWDYLPKSVTYALQSKF
ncbi:hypothetical protein [Acidithrix ferrooxidans]|uniref:Uncharacterized protein n=1 Tax=Acidithrix ferrooxidans TaxID=1280514 RepID=A0A0D8HNR0_9ACTN|nr:hypothetical protein [Acidithrix ferrooxidans]KJF18771.1 hypothetical protein AXFE_03800 [Acidithrix ferrooxidans]